MDKALKLCKCGNPVQNITLKQYYTKKDGRLSIYLVSPTRCQACVNKAKRERKQNRKFEDNFLLNML